MSICDIPVDDYGLVLSDNILQYVSSKACKNYSKEEWFEDMFRFLDDLYMKGIIEYISSFTGSAFGVSEDGKDNDRLFESQYCDDVIYYVPLLKLPDLFHGAYKNFDEVETELKNRVGKYFPENYKFKHNVCHIVGTYYG